MKTLAAFILTIILSLPALNQNNKKPVQKYQISTLLLAERNQDINLIRKCFQKDDRIGNFLKISKHMGGMCYGMMKQLQIEIILRGLFLLIEDEVPTHLLAATGTGPKAWQFDKTWNMVFPLKH